MKSDKTYVVSKGSKRELLLQGVDEHSRPVAEPYPYVYRFGDVGIIHSLFDEYFKELIEKGKQTRLQIREQFEGLGIPFENESGKETITIWDKEIIAPPVNRTLCYHCDGDDVLVLMTHGDYGHFFRREKVDSSCVFVPLHEDEFERVDGSDLPAVKEKIRGLYESRGEPFYHDLEKRVSFQFRKLHEFNLFGNLSRIPLEVATRVFSKEQIQGQTQFHRKLEEYARIRRQSLANAQFQSRRSYTAV